jgi:hypothetical protein
VYSKLNIFTVDHKFLEKSILLTTEKDGYWLRLQTKPTDMHTLPSSVDTNGGRKCHLAFNSRWHFLSSFFLSSELCTAVDEDVVLVTVNYRLIPFSFLSLETNHLPGNQGLKVSSPPLHYEL